MAMSPVLLLLFIGLLTSDAAMPAVVPGTILFYDQDDNCRSLGGPLLFQRASPETGVTYYAVYWGSSPFTRLVPFLQLSATGVDPQYLIPMATSVPVIGTTTATYFLVYAANTYGEALTGSVLAFHDRCVPTYPPAGITFQDTDLVQGTLTGQVTIAKAVDESTVTNYVLYFGRGPMTLSSYITTIAKGSSLVYTMASKVGCVSCIMRASC